MPSFFRSQTRSHIRLWTSITALLMILLLSACGRENANNTNTDKTTQGNKTRLNVVVAENFWGSIAAQLGGDRVSVVSLISAPTGDPHDYESTPKDARNMAQAQYAIITGAHYDEWAETLIEANPSQERKVLDIGTLVGAKKDDNPHLWYKPAYVEQAAKQITADYKTLDAANAPYYDAQYKAFDASMKTYRDTIATIKAKYAGTKIGISESIFMYMAEALGLDIITPASYYNAEANGGEPSAASIATFNKQLTSKEVKVFILNIQTIDNATRNLQDEVLKQNIPIVEVSETVRPANGTFQDWQVDQLQKLNTALQQVTAK